MRHLLIIAISMIAAMGATPSLAQSRITTNSQIGREIVQISPFDLVTRGYQGHFVDQDIPAAGRFISAVRANKIKAEDLVKVAIAKRRLPEKTLQDRTYLSHVKTILHNLDRN